MGARTPCVTFDLAVLAVMVSVRGEALCCKHIRMFGWPYLGHSGACCSLQKQMTELAENTQTWQPQCSLTLKGKIMTSPALLMDESVLSVALAGKKNNVCVTLVCLAAAVCSENAFNFLKWEFCRTCDTCFVHLLHKRNTQSFEGTEA